MKDFPRNEWPRPRRMNGHWCYWFFEPTYRENIHLLWGVNDKQRHAYMRKYFDVSDFSGERDGVWGGRTTEIFEPGSTESCAQMIALHEWNGTPKDYSILAHEIFHAANHIASTRGVMCGNDPKDTNEPYAYLIQSLTLSCVRALNFNPRKPHARRHRFQEAVGHRDLDGARSQHPVHDARERGPQAEGVHGWRSAEAYPAWRQRLPAGEGRSG